jgi:cytochrome c peroxidase
VRYTDIEREGARAFHVHCAGCHAPRVIAERADSEVAFDAWEASIFRRSAALVWARADYAKTGVEPYVHERGARIPSLRRLALKPRYFTNGSARDLEAVLAGFRTTPEGALHRAGVERSASTPLSEPLRAALLAFLQLL